MAADELHESAAMRHELEALAREIASPDQRSNGLARGDRLLSSWTMLDRRGISTVRAMLDPEGQVALAVYAHRSFERAVGMGRPEILDCALFALLLSHPMGDWREWLIVASLYPRSSELLGVDSAEVLRRVGVAASTDAVKAMSDFLGRRPEDRSIGAMGWRELWSEAGVLFVHSPARQQSATIAEIAERFKRTDH